jgi:hypothetical protein
MQKLRGTTREWALTLAVLWVLRLRHFRWRIRWLIRGNFRRRIRPLLVGTCVGAFVVTIDMVLDLEL